MAERFQPRQYSGDDSAATGFAYICRPMWSKGNFNDYKVKQVDGSLSLGQYNRVSRGEMYSYVCGGWGRSQPNKGSGDDTGFNGMVVDLCSLYRKR